MTSQTEKAVLAGGCFWGVQELIRRQPGILSTRVGYTGGDVPNATYRNHGTHAEGIEIIFNPQETSFRRCLSFSSKYMIPPLRIDKAMTKGCPTAVSYTHLTLPTIYSV